MSKQPHEFFKLTASYQVAPGASQCDLLNDADILLSIVSGSLMALAMDAESEGGGAAATSGFSQLLYGLGYLAGMARNVADAAHSEVLAAQRAGGAA